MRKVCVCLCGEKQEGGRGGAGNHGTLCVCVSVYGRQVTTVRET